MVSLKKIISKPVLFNEKNLAAGSLSFNEMNLQPFRKLLKIVAKVNENMIIRLFENPKGLNDDGIHGVWLC